MVKNIPLNIKRRLRKLYHIITSGTFPHKWKEAVSTPILKHGKNVYHLENCSVISLFPTVKKILEKILARRFLRHTGRNFSKIQHALRSRYGVRTLCHQLEEVLRNNLAMKKHSLVISADIQDF